MRLWPRAIEMFAFFCDHTPISNILCHPVWIVNRTRFDGSKKYGEQYCDITTHTCTQCYDCERSIFVKSQHCLKFFCDNHHNLITLMWRLHDNYNIFCRVHWSWILQAPYPTSQRIIQNSFEIAFDCDLPITQSKHSFDSVEDVRIIHWTRSVWPVKRFWKHQKTNCRLFLICNYNLVFTSIVLIYLA